METMMLAGDDVSEVGFQKQSLLTTHGIQYSLRIIHHCVKVQGDFFSIHSRCQLGIPRADLVKPKKISITIPSTRLKVPKNDLPKRSSPRPRSFHALH